MIRDTGRKRPKTAFRATGVGVGGWRDVGDVWGDGIQPCITSEGHFGTEVYTPDTHGTVSWEGLPNYRESLSEFSTKES